MIKYRARYGGITEVRIEVENETEKCVWINGRRLLKSIYYETYFNSFQEAKDFLIKNQENKIKDLQENLNRQGLILHRFYNMEPEANV